MLSEKDSLLDPIADDSVDTTPKDEGDTGEGGDQTQPSFKPQYKTWEEAEKAVTEAKKAFHQKSEEVSLYKKMLQNVKQTAPPTTEDGKESPRRKIAREALQKINALKDEDPDKDEKAADIWLEAQERIAEQKMESRRVQEMSDQEVADYAEAKAKKAGFSSPMMLDAFWLVCRNAPRNAALDEQIDWAIGRVNEFIEGIRAEDTRKREEEGGGKVPGLGRGGRGPKEEKVENATLGDTLKAVANSRRVKMGDLQR